MNIFACTLAYWETFIVKPQLFGGFSKYFEYVKQKDEYRVFIENTLVL